jgi:hypothetical protein
MGLAWLYVVFVLIQFLAAGLMILGFDNADEFEDYRSMHEGIGYSALHLTPILFIIAAAIGRVPRNLLVLTIVFAVVAFVQPLWVTEFRGEFLGSLHVLGAAVILAMAHEIATMSTRLVRSEAGASQPATNP